MAMELEALENHLNILETQNKRLEDELDSFMRCDDQVKDVLRSRSPPKVRFQ